jgi:hypothetical protein
MGNHTPALNAASAASERVRAPVALPIPSIIYFSFHGICGVKLCPMETFRVRRDADPAVRKQEAWRFLLAAGPYWAFLLLRELRWPSPYERSESLLERVVWTFFESVFFALALQCLSWFGPETYEIAIDEHQITAIKGRFKRSVRRDQVRTVLENSGWNLFISWAYDFKVRPIWNQDARFGLCA